MIIRYLDKKAHEDQIPSFVVSYTIDYFFVLNLYLRFNCFMYYEEGLIIFDREHIRKNFWKKHNITLEIIASIPFD